MNLQSLTCSRELAQRMAELGICQDGAELWWSRYQLGVWKVIDEKDKEWEEETFKGTEACSYIIAPTLPRMMEELPDFWHIYRVVDIDKKQTWYIEDNDNEFEFSDKNLLNAVAKALIAIAEGKQK